MSLNCPVCGTAIALTLTANPPQATANGAAKSPQTDSKSPQTNTDFAAVAGIGVGSKGLKVRTYNPATGRKRFDYDDPDFVAFWDVYPLRKEKAAAFAVWKRVVAAGVAAPQTLIDAAAKYAAFCDRNHVELRHRKYPAGWLAGGRWDDEYPEEKQDARYEPYDHEAHLRALEEIQ